MKRNILIASIVILGLTVLAKAHIFDALLLFVLFGAVPGTTLIIPSVFMILMMASIAWLFIFHMAFAARPEEMAMAPPARPTKKGMAKKPVRRTKTRA